MGNLDKKDESRVGRDQQRYAESGARMVAGCICLNEAKDKVIMISSSKHKDRWILPKGGIELDEGEDFVVSAVRETWEEAGIEGKITQKLPVVYDKRKDAPIIKGEFNDIIPKTEFHFYEMIIDTLSVKWPESDQRQRKWCSYSEAKHELIKSNRLELIDALNSCDILKDEELDEDAY